MEVGSWKVRDCYFRHKHLLAPKARVHVTGYVLHCVLLSFERQSLWRLPLKDRVDSGAWEVGRHWAQTEQPLCLWKKQSRKPGGFWTEWQLKRFEARSKETFLLVFVEAGLSVFANKSGLPQRNAYLHQLQTKITCSSEFGWMWIADWVEKRWRDYLLSLFKFIVSSLLKCLMPEINTVF